MVTTAEQVQVVKDMIREQVPDDVRIAFYGLPAKEFDREDLLRLLIIANKQQEKQYEQHDQDLRSLGGLDDPTRMPSRLWFAGMDKVLLLLAVAAGLYAVSIVVRLVGQYSCSVGGAS